MIEHWCSVCCNSCGRRTEERQPNVRAAREAAKVIGWKIGVRLAKYHPPVDYCPQCEQAGRIGGGE